VACIQSQLLILDKSDRCPRCLFWQQFFIVLRDVIQRRVQ